MSSEQGLLSSVVNIIVIIFQKRKLNEFGWVTYTEKKFNTYQPLKIKREKVEVNEKTLPTYPPSSKIRVKSETRLIFFRPLQYLGLGHKSLTYIKCFQLLVCFIYNNQTEARYGMRLWPLKLISLGIIILSYGVVYYHDFCGGGNFTKN